MGLKYESIDSESKESQKARQWAIIRIVFPALCNSMQELEFLLILSYNDFWRPP